MTQLPVSAMSVNRILKPLLFVLALLPLVWLGWGAWQDTLGANPLETITRSLGEWALRFLLLTLLVSPLRRATGWAAVLRLRRMVGLFAFFYASLHWLSYLWLDQFFDWQEIWYDISKRPFIAAGMLAFLMLLPLALTSTQAAMRRLGRNWQRLHWLVYPLTVLALVHFWWLADSKLTTDRPLVYSIMLAVLLAERLFRLRQRSISASSRSASAMRM